MHRQRTGPHNTVATVAARRRRRNRKRTNWRPIITRWVVILAALALVVFLLTNHRFIVRRVDFDGNRTIPAGRLSLLVPVPSHQNVFLYVLAHHKRIAQTIKQAEPPIDQVHVRPGLPNRLVVHVTERSPFVQLRENHGGLWLVDRNGVPYREISSRKVNLVAVIVPFGSVDPIILGKPLPLGNGSMLGTAFTALAAARKVSALGPDEIKDIRVDQSLNLCLNTSNNLLIKLGQPDNLGIKIADAAAIMTDDAQQADSAVYIDVSEPKHPAFMPRPGSTLVGASSN